MRCGHPRRPRSFALRTPKEPLPPAGASGTFPNKGGLMTADDRYCQKGALIAFEF